jgi:UDP-N-acetyl-2-amino-2-deoxyglucuronate dehydrogenase
VANKIFRAALIGCGRVARHYVQILTKLDPVERLDIVACCDLVEERARFVGAALDASPHTSIGQMLSEAKPDIAIVLTPSGYHYDHARQALDAGCHVLVEKPVVMMPAQVNELAELARSCGLYYGGVFQNRYNPAIRKLREVMQSGRLGLMVTAAIRLRWCRTQDYYEDGWHGTWAMDGGVINQQAIHHVDALSWICGPIEAVCAAAGNRLNQLEAEDTMVAAIRFANGALGTIEATTAARPEDFEASLSLVGEKGIVQIGGIALNQIELWRFVQPVPDDLDIPVRFSQHVPTGYGLGHGPLLKDWIGRLESGAYEPPIPAQEAVKAVELVHALYASIERDSWVRLADEPRSSRLGISRLGNVA